MKRATHFQWQYPLCTGFLQCSTCLFKCRKLTCDNNLSRTVVICDHSSRNVLQHGFYLFFFHAQHCTHTADSRRYGVLHQLSALSDKKYCILHGKCPGCSDCRVFSKTESCSHFRSDPPHKQFLRDHQTDCNHRRLCKLRLIDLFIFCKTDFFQIKIKLPTDIIKVSAHCFHKNPVPCHISVPPVRDR